jgi:hypothetical protein
VFIRIMRGRVVDGAGTRLDLVRWRQEMGGGSPGWQRLTAGVTDDGEAVAVLRFADEAAARRSTERPEHAAWQATVDRRLSGPATWYDCPVVSVLKGGDDAEAGFVQVMHGRLVDPVRLAAMRAEVERTLRERAPHVLGVSVAEHADGVGFTEVTYFTSEREARAGERQMPVEMAVQLGTVRSYMERLEFSELRDPLVVSGPAVPVP